MAEDSGGRLAVAPSNGEVVIKRTRSVAEIEAEIAASRESLVRTVTQLQVAVKVAIDPRRILTRQLDKINAVFLDEYGGVRPERVLIVAGGLVTLIVVRRAGRRRRSRR